MGKSKHIATDSAYKDVLLQDITNSQSGDKVVLLYSDDDSYQIRNGDQTLVIRPSYSWFEPVKELHSSSVTTTVLKSLMRATVRSAGFKPGCNSILAILGHFLFIAIFVLWLSAIVFDPITFNYANKTPVKNETTYFNDTIVTTNALVTSGQNLIHYVGRQAALGDLELMDLFDSRGL